MKRRAVFFDLDGTLYRWQLFEVWIKRMVQLEFMAAEVVEEALGAYTEYENRRGSFSAYVTLQIAAYQRNARMKGIRVEDAKLAAEEVIRHSGEKVHVFPRELLLAAQDCGYEVVFISGSPIEVVGALALARGVNVFLGTEHPHDGVYFTGGPPKEWCYEKDNAVRLLAERHDLDLENSFAIGDSMSDVKMFECVGRSICMNPTRELHQAARGNWPVVLEKKDLITFLEAKDEFSRYSEVELADVLPFDLFMNFERNSRLAR
jgi:HAD superfamily hydrolase (TIGR01490 family)